MDRKAEHQKILDLIHDTYIIKNKKYGNSFSDAYEEYGPLSVMIRLTDKFLRMKQLMKANQLGDNDTDESLEDTLLDAANYCIMAIIELRFGTWNPPVSSNIEKAVESIARSVEAQHETIANFVKHGNTFVFNETFKSDLRQMIRNGIEGKLNVPD